MASPMDTSDMCFRHATQQNANGQPVNPPQVGGATLDGAAAAATGANTFASFTAPLNPAGGFSFGASASPVQASPPSTQPSSNNPFAQPSPAVGFAFPAQSTQLQNPTSAQQPSDFNAFRTAFGTNPLVAAAPAPATQDSAEATAQASATVLFSFGAPGGAPVFGQQSKANHGVASYQVAPAQASAPAPFSLGVSGVAPTFAQPFHRDHGTATATTSGAPFSGVIAAPAPAAHSWMGPRTTPSIGPGHHIGTPRHQGRGVDFGSPARTGGGSSQSHPSTPIHFTTASSPYGIQSMAPMDPPVYLSGPHQHQYYAPSPIHHFRHPYSLHGNAMSQHPRANESTHHDPPPPTDRGGRDYIRRLGENKFVEDRINELLGNGSTSLMSSIMEDAEAQFPALEEKAKRAVATIKEQIVEKEQKKRRIKAEMERLMLEVDDDIAKDHRVLAVKQTYVDELAGYKSIHDDIHFILQSPAHSIAHPNATMNSLTHKLKTVNRTTKRIPDFSQVGQTYNEACKRIREDLCLNESFSVDQVFAMDTEGPQGADKTKILTHLLECLNTHGLHKHDGFKEYIQELSSGHDAILPTNYTPLSIKHGKPRGFSAHCPTLQKFRLCMYFQLEGWQQRCKDALYTARLGGRPLAL